jgi:hypothetical protein
MDRSCLRAGGKLDKLDNLFFERLRRSGRLLDFVFWYVSLGGKFVRQNILVVLHAFNIYVNNILSVRNGVYYRGIALLLSYVYS